MKYITAGFVITVVCLAGLQNQAVAETKDYSAGKSFQDCQECPEMVVIPAGSFVMGSGNGGANEKPEHHVTISRAFAMGKTEVTQAQWKDVMGDNPSYFKNCGDNCPVEQVSWNDVQGYIKKLNAKTGKQYRLPSEAEWEYACRAGGKHEYCGSNVVDSVAWYVANSNPPGSSKKTSNPVGLKQANAFGLYDMSGNVWEWVEDGYHDSYTAAPADGRAWQKDGNKKILRGGAWDDEMGFSRATVRYMKAAQFKTNYDGFRLARTLP